MDLLNLWGTLQEYPWLISLTIFLALTFLSFVFFAAPILVMVLSEPNQFAGWFKKHRSAIKEARERNAKPVEIYLRASILVLDSVNVIIGNVASWLALLMVMMQFAVVIMRYVFAWGSIQMQESIWYMHGLLFMLAVGYTLLKDGHVRVDVIYRNASEKKKAVIDLLGTIIFLLPICYITWTMSWTYVLNSWDVLETSIEGSGLPYIYLFKTVILVFVVLLFLQGLAVVMRCIMVLLGMKTDDLRAHSVGG